MWTGPKSSEFKLTFQCEKCSCKIKCYVNTKVESGGGAIKIVSEFLPLTSARINHHCLWLTYVGLAIRPTKYENF